MCDCDWKRARSREQVEHRNNEVLDAASRLFRRVPYDGVTLQMIAKEAGFTRSNLYRYFSTKEEIFLTLYLADIQAWRRDISESLGGNLSIEQFASAWTEITCRHRRLLDLSPLLATTLERNASEDLYRRTKRELGDVMRELTGVLVRALPALTPDRAAGFLKFYLALVSGSWPMSRYSEIQLGVLKELGMEEVIIDFPSMISESLLAYMRGILE